MPESTADTTNPRETFEAFATAYLQLWRDVYSPETDAAQWEHGRTPRPVDDGDAAGIKSNGIINNPTYSTVVDTRRLAVRDAVRKAERALAQADHAMAHAIKLLEAAHASE